MNTGFVEVFVMSNSDVISLKPITVYTQKNTAGDIKLIVPIDWIVGEAGLISKKLQIQKQ